MKALLDRWQFGVTITDRFLFGERLTRFFGTLFLINLAMGVVTGIVQEFQFGMNWSSYSVFVGNVFGPPLAMEGLLAFFAESTFIASPSEEIRRRLSMTATQGAAAAARDNGGLIQRVPRPGLTGLRMWPSARTRTVG